MKKISILLVMLLCFSLCSCSSNNNNFSESKNTDVDKNNTISANDDVEWYIKKKEFTQYDSTLECMVKTLYEYDSKARLIHEEMLKETSSGFETYSDKIYKYDDENKISSIGLTFEGKSHSVTFDKHYIDGYCVCSGEVPNEGTISYYYKNDILFKTEAYTTDTEILYRNYFDEKGNTVKVEYPNSYFIEYEYDDDNNLTKYLWRASNGKSFSDTTYIYDGNYIIKEINESEYGVSETEYNIEKIDNNTYKRTVKDNDNQANYNLYVFDDYGNIIRNSTYRSDGSLLDETIVVWEKVKP